MEWYEEDPRRTNFESIADSIEVSVDALMFSYDLLFVTPQYLGEEPGDIDDPVRHCSAKEICQALPHYAQDLFGEEWLNALRDMGIYRSEDLGRIIFGLVKVGYLSTRPEDLEEDFVGLCRFVDIA